MDLTRRGLLRGLLGGAAALALPGVALVLPEEEVVSTKTTFVLGDGQHRGGPIDSWHNLYLRSRARQGIADPSLPRFHGIPGKSSLEHFNDFVKESGPAFFTDAEELINETIRNQYMLRRFLRPTDAAPPTYKGIPILQHKP